MLWNVKEGVAVSRMAYLDPNSDGSALWNDLAKHGQLSDSKSSETFGESNQTYLFIYSLIFISFINILTHVK